jgi:dipeptidyl aminopeptidase/acylaminoacyl peptidase
MSDRTSASADGNSKLTPATYPKANLAILCSALSEVHTEPTMRVSTLFVALSFGASVFGQSSSPDDRAITDPKAVSSLTNPAARAVPIDDLYYTRSVFDPAWSPDGKEVVFVSDMAGRLNIWKANSSGGWPIQLTQSDERQFSPVWSPDGKWIVYQQDSGGNELWDLCAVPSNGGNVVNLTNTPDAREEGPLWSNDGKTVAFSYKPKDATIYDIELLDWQSRKVRRLTNETTKTYSWSPVAWSADGQYLFANRGEVSGVPEGDVYRIEVASSKTENLTAHEGKRLYAATSLSRDGKTLLITSDEKGGYQNVAFLDVATKQRTWVTDTKWEASSGNFSSDGKSFTYTINADGRIDAYIALNASKRAEKVALAEGLNTFSGNPSPYAPDGNRILVKHQSSTQPGDLWVYDIARHNSTRLTYSAIASLTTTPMPPSQIVHYKSFDGKTISALMWIPFNLKRDGSNPALVLPHGGPTGQMVDYWNTSVAAYVSRGYVCIAPNVRGSTGYGLEFQKANYKDLGGGDLQDEVYAAKFLDATGYVNSKKIGITGGSYGGFMTLMAMGRTPDVWAAAVEEYGIINWYTMLQHEDPLLQEYEKSLLGDPEKDRKAYEAASPITYLHGANAPLLVLQGDNDPRVPKEEAEQVVSILKADGKTVDAHYYPNEGHGFEKRENRIDAIRRSVEWFDKYLKVE